MINKSKEKMELKDRIKGRNKEQRNLRPKLLEARHGEGKEGWLAKDYGPSTFD